VAKIKLKWAYFIGTQYKIDVSKPLLVIILKNSNLLVMALRSEIPTDYRQGIRRANLNMGN